VSGRETFSITAAGGELGGWLTGDGPRTLLLHGGPGLSFEYLNELGDELATDFRVAAYQQRGLEPSTLQGPFTVAQAVDDAIAVLDALGWEHIELDPPEIEGVEINLDEHREALEAGLDDATMNTARIHRGGIARPAAASSERPRGSGVLRRIAGDDPLSLLRPCFVP